MQPCATFLLLENLVGATAGIGLITCCWALRHPLRWAHHYDATMTEAGLFSALPIYGYLRRYLQVMLIAGLVILLASLVTLIAQWGSCDDLNAVGPICGLLLALAALHLPTIGWFVKDRQGDGSNPQKQYQKDLVNAVGRRLWGLAVALLVPAGLLFILRALASASS